MRKIYDLLAELVAKIKAYPSTFEPEDLTEESECRLVADVQNLLLLHKNELSNCALYGLPIETYNEIISWAISRNNYYLYRIMLCMIDSDPLVALEQSISNKKSAGFISLNDNFEETGIYILPQVAGPKTTYSVKSRTDETQEITIVRKTADEWADNLNAQLNNFYYICNTDLDGFTLRNYVCDLTYNDPSIKELKVAVSPLLNLPIDDVLSYDDTIIETDECGNEYRLFDILHVKPESEILTRIQDGYRTASEHGANILMFPEMLGIEAIYSLDSLGYNPIFRTLCKETADFVPQLILAPSLWKANTNSVNIYLSSGKKLCVQEKQHRYSFRGKNGKCKENLKDIDRTISILHVPGWGRIVVPICIDFLNEPYRHLLVTKLKADILLCPSYSSGEYNFLSAIDAYSEYGAYTVWLNTCSALNRKVGDVPELVGAASAPVVSSHSRIVRFCPTCAGNCLKGCLFMVSLPLDCAGSSQYEGRGVAVEHIVLK